MKTQKLFALALLSATLGLFAGCGGGSDPKVPDAKFGSPDIRAEGYDQSCKRDADCVVIQIGNMCTCGCDFGSINREQESQYNQDKGFVHCTDDKPDCAQCPIIDDPVCDSGVCALRPKG